MFKFFDDRPAYHASVALSSLSNHLRILRSQNDSTFGQAPGDPRRECVTFFRKHAASLDDVVGKDAATTAIETVERAEALLDAHHFARAHRGKMPTKAECDRVADDLAGVCSKILARLAITPDRQHEDSAGWSVWMSKGDVCDILLCPEKKLEERYPGRVREGATRQQWAFRVATFASDPVVMARYAKQLEKKTRDV